ncbi:transposase [Streptomyces sp. NPDC053755]|uniref:IS701 family transposase n=1 Tax=Streptomyces sp. NPDC053755 TaxID=3155815 RepID=UPI003446EBFC
MNGTMLLHADPIGEDARLGGGGRARAGDAVLAELGAELFSSMPRSDQRVKGMRYVRGLLEAEGRKSIRNIATLFGGDAEEQSLHHFIAGSTWDWVPVRRALAQHVERVAQPEAYVVHPLVIPKAGETSVGVERRFVPTLGQVVNAQQAVGVWSASADWSTPLNWRLYLPHAWLADRRRRRQASIPDSEEPETLGQCSVRAYLGLINSSRLPVRPVVMDARHTDVSAVVQRLRAADTPMLLRVDGNLRLTVDEPAFPRRGAAMTAQQIMSAVWHMWHPGARPGEDRAGRSLVVTLRTSLVPDGRRTGHTGPLLLMGVSEHGRWPAELWLTDLTSHTSGELLRLARLTRQVDRDLEEVADGVGIRDFSGRSFTGWHRHATLASAAHAVTVLSRGPGRARPWRAPLTGGPDGPVRMI